MSSDRLLEIKNLTFSYPGAKPVLKNLSFYLNARQRMLLVGANGTGKTTLLELCAGTRMTPVDSTVHIAGRSPFYDPGVFPLITYVGQDLDLSLDISFLEMYEQLESQSFSSKELDSELVSLLQIQPYWRMHQLSQGERKRVELFFSMRKKSANLFLFDEVTAHLDVDVRERILEWLKKSQKTIVYCTHIFDSLIDNEDAWATSLLWLGKNGSFAFIPPEEFSVFIREKYREKPSLSAWVSQSIRENRWVGGT